MRLELTFIFMPALITLSQESQPWRLVGAAPNRKLKGINFKGLDEALEAGETYRIESVYGLSLTAQHGGVLTPGGVTLTPWQQLPYQLWEVNRIDEGLLLTPIKNDFNDVTYFLEAGASAHHVWVLGRPVSKVLAELSLVSGMYLLRNKKSLCLQGQREGGRVDFKACRPTSLNQYWRFHKLELGNEAQE